MKDYRWPQIPFKTYMSEFKECKHIQKNDQYEIFNARNINTRKKHLVVKKLNCQLEDTRAIFSDFCAYEKAEHIPFINRFIGYVVENYMHQLTGIKMLHLYFLFQFEEVTLDSYIHNIFERGRQESLSFLYLVHDALIEISKNLSHYNQALKFLFFDLKLTSIHIQGESIGKVAFSFLPFTFLMEERFSQKNFTTQIYSLKDLDKINSEEKSDQIQMLFQRKYHQPTKTSFETTSTEVQIRQKIGLFLVKLLLLCCQQIHIRETEVNLYDVNKDFRIDYNWDLINPLLMQCSKQKNYRQIAKIIQFLLLGKQTKNQEPYKQHEHRSLQKSSKKSNPRLQSNKKSSKKLNSQQPCYQSSGKKYSPGTRQTITQKKAFIENRIHQLKDAVEIKHQNGKYVGQIFNGKRQGLGIYYFQQGQIYGGEWKDDEMIGNGIYLFLTQNEYYEGKVQNGTRSGFGCYYYNNGNVYTGNWLNDEKQGYGELFIASSNQFFKGNFQNNLQHGIGTIEYSNGSKFQGHFEHGIKQGSGQIYNSKNEVTLKGTWINNEISGKVEIFFQNGDYYQGFMKSGLMNGQGLYKYKCGTIYIGEFVQNCMSGNCSITYVNGDTYSGEMLNGKFSSKGTYHYKKEGMTEISQWAEGSQVGVSQFICDDRHITTILRDRKFSTLLMKSEV